MVVPGPGQCRDMLRELWRSHDLVDNTMAALDRDCTNKASALLLAIA